MSYKLTKEAIKEVLSKESERRTLIGIEQLGFLSPDTFPEINSFYTGILVARARADWITPIDLSLYWTENGLTKPIDYVAIGVFSRRSFNYGQVMSFIQLPDPSDYQSPPNLSLYFCGFERGSGIHSGLATWFAFNQIVQVAVWSAFAGVTLDVTSLLPADYRQNGYWYTTKVNKNCVEFYIGHRTVAPETLVAVVVTPATGSIYSLDGPPYSIAIAPAELSTMMDVLVNVTYGDLTRSVNLPLSARRVIASDGDPRPPRVYRLYELSTTTLLAGSSVDPNVTSHPFPLFGYEGKTINFMSDEAGNLDIEVLKTTGNWRIHSTIGILANTLSTTTIADEEIIGRIVFTPTLPPANILEAEVILR